MWKHMEKVFAIILGCMSVAILLAEATLLPSGLDLSLFSILINSVGKEEMLVQVNYSIFSLNLAILKIKFAKFSNNHNGLYELFPYL